MEILARKKTEQIGDVPLVDIVKRPLLLYSNNYWVVQESEFRFENCILQQIYTLFPLDENKNPMSVSFNFKNLQQALSFRDEYHIRHTLDFWRKKSDRVYDWNVIYYLKYQSRIKLM